MAKNPKGLLFLTFFALGCFLILGSFLYLSDSRSSGPIPLYEEKHEISAGLDKKVCEIDSLVYEAFFKCGIDEKDVSFPLVIPMRKKGSEWNFTELMVKLSDQKEALRLEKAIIKVLSGLDAAVKFDTKEESKSEWVCRVFAMGRYTHKIRLAYGNYRGMERSGFPEVSIIIDDMGYDDRLAASFMDLDLPLSFSVLPLAPYTEYIASEAAKRGRELLLHVPMEPNGYPGLNPGPGALFAEMGEDEIRERLNELIRGAPGIKGVNHHMGSCFTERRDKMSIVLRELRKHDLFYVDSRTTSRTVAYDLAIKIGVPAARKDVFLDHDPSPVAIKFQIERLLGIARYSGKAVGIGHPHEETLKALHKYRNRLRDDFKVVPVSKLVN